MEKQKVALGRVVLYGFSDGKGGVVERPGEIVRIWGDDCVNLQVSLDGHNDVGLQGLPDGACRDGRCWVTSATRADDESGATAHKFRFPPRV